jgi:hypothetical protein
MTVCIAALAEEGKSCIVAADRQVTVAGFSLQFEHPDKKIERLFSSCLVMSSGDALLAAQLVERTRHAISLAGNPTVQSAAELLRDIYMTIHLERCENVILRPRGWTFKEFKEYGAQRLPLQSFLQIDKDIFNFGLAVVEFIVAGTDSTGAHIFRVHYTGIMGGDWMEWCDRLGYRTIGSGTSHSAILLSLEGQHSALSLKDTLFNVYCAKRNSEVAPGVGPGTDMAIIREGMIEDVSADRLDKMSKLRDNQKTRLSQSEIETI